MQRNDVHRIEFVPLFVVFILFGSVFIPAAQGESQPVVIKNVRIFDGDKLLSESTLVFDGETIVALGPDIDTPTEARVIDGTGKTLMPGLIDAHVHTIGRLQDLEKAAVFGVTTVLDMFMATVANMTEIKAAQATNAYARAQFFSAGILVTAPGGHGTEYGIAIPTISAPEEAQTFVDARIAEGSDYIKIVYDDGSAYGFSIPTLDLATLAAVVDAAHRRDKIAVVHIGSLAEARDAIEVGADGLAHLNADGEIDPTFAELVHENDAFVIPTLSVLESIMGTPSGQSLVTDLRLEPYLSQDARRSLKQSFQARPDGPQYHAVEMTLMHLHGAKVPILAGTDAGNPGTTMGASMHRELELMVQSGMVPLEALKACTSVPAEQFKLADRGRLRIGMRADLVLVNGDPTTDITATRDIVATWVGGMPVDRTAFRTMIAEAKEREAARLAATPADAAWSLVSDFESDDLSSEFGAGWAVSTDALRGGKSKATLHRGNGGAEGSSGAMRVECELVEGFQFPWAGAMFYPGKTQMASADLSSKKKISFWAKGSDNVVTLMVFTQANGFTPIMRSFPLGSDWKPYTVTFDELSIDGQGFMGLYLGCGTKPGSFTLFIDDVRFD